jgi:uroporphyrinogen-III synthase
MPSLKGIRVALLEARMSGELADLVRRFGGVPYSAQAVREVPRLEQVPALIDALSEGRFSIVVFLTGVGVMALMREAERIGRLEEALTALRATTIACRGPKPSAALNRYNVPVQIKAIEPYTTMELLDGLKGVDLRVNGVALVHYGERNQVLANELAARGARLEEWCLYEWLLPEDIRPLAALVGHLIDRRVDAIAFTSQIQCRNLFRLAADVGKSDELESVLNNHTIVAAIGPVCATALRALGITPDVLPAHPKMGPLIAALADYVDLSDETSARGVNP